MYIYCVIYIKIRIIICNIYSYLQFNQDFKSCHIKLLTKIYIYRDIYMIINVKFIDICRVTNFREV